MAERVIGYILLIVGLGIIVFSAANVWLVFTGAASPVQIFHLSGLSLDLSSQLGLPKTAGVKPAELISATDLNTSMNLFTHLFLMGFLAGIGQKIASLGVNLLRPIVVKSNQ